jgi:hypothetical protein
VGLHPEGRDGDIGILILEVMYASSPSCCSSEATVELVDGQHGLDALGEA